MVQTLTLDLSFSCVTVVVEEQKELSLQIRRHLMQMAFPTLIIESDDIEDMFDILEKADIKCVTYIFLSKNKLQQFMKDVTEEHDINQLASTHWFIWMENFEVSFDLNKFGFNSDVTLLIEQDGQTILQDVYSVNVNEGFVDMAYGFYNDSSGLSLKFTNKWKRRRDLQGITLKAIALEQLGFLETNNQITEHNKRNINRLPWVGVFPDIFESLAESLNFSFALVSSRDGNWGSYDQETDTWNGAVKDLKDGVADLAPSSVTISHIRSTAIDFSLPIVSSKNCFMISAVPSYSLDIFSRPFRIETWAFLYLTIFIMACFLALIAKAGNEEKVSEFGLEKSFIFVYGALSALAARRWSVTPVKISGR